MTLKELLEKISRFQKVTVYYGDSRKADKAANLLNNLSSNWLKSPVIEIKADSFSELLVEVGD